MSAPNDDALQLTRDKCFHCQLLDVVAVLTPQQPSSQLVMDMLKAACQVAASCERAEVPRATTDRLLHDAINVFLAQARARIDKDPTLAHPDNRRH